MKGVILSSTYIPLKTRLESHQIPVTLTQVEQIGAYVFPIYGTRKLILSTGHDLTLEGFECIKLPIQEGLRFSARDARYSHDGTHLWIGYGNNSTTTHAGIEAVMRLLPSSSIQVHVVYSDGHLDTWFLPLSNTKVLLCRPSQEVAKVFGTKNVIQVPKKYSQACLSVCLPGILLVPKFIQARSWLYKATGLRIEEVNLESISLNLINLGSNSLDEIHL